MTCVIDLNGLPSKNNIYDLFHQIRTLSDDPEFTPDCLDFCISLLDAYIRLAEEELLINHTETISFLYDSLCLADDIVAKKGWQYGFQT